MVRYLEANLTAESLTMFAGVILSLAFSYIPKLNSWFDGLQAEYKRLIMAGLTLAVAAAAYGLACYGIETGVTCDQTGVIGLLKAWLLTVIANQAAYALTPRRK